MYSAFQMSLTEDDKDFLEQYYQSGKSFFTMQSQKVRLTIDSCLNKDGSLDAARVEDDWFPSIKEDIFLSHSHQDEYYVIALAGFFESLGMSTFVDSAVWGYCNDLQKEIDDKYCWKKESKTYSYERRNNSTAHVHAILMGALMKMIDNTECLIFVNTPNSMDASDIKMDVTRSPWIYSELLMTQVIRKSEPIRKGQAFFEARHDGLEMTFPVDLSEMNELSIDNIIDAYNEKNEVGKKLLDRIYQNRLTYIG